MTPFETAGVTLISHLMFKVLNGASDEIRDRNYTIEPIRGLFKGDGERFYLSVEKMSLSNCAVNQTNAERYKIFHYPVERTPGKLRLKTDERQHIILELEKKGANEIEVIEWPRSKRYTIESPSYGEIKVYSHESRRTYLYHIVG